MKGAPADPRVTAVVLTRNRREEVLRSVARMRRAPAPARVIVVDNGSTDGTPEALAIAFADVLVLRLSGNAGAAGRNAGAERAATPYVAFCDDDTWWASGMIGRAADLFDRCPRLAVLTARVLVGADEREDPASAEMARSPLPPEPGVPGVPVLGFMAGACMMRRTAFLAAGGFEPRLSIGGEEALLAADLAVQGWALAYAPEVIVHHAPSPRRDAAARSRVLLRNALWFAWLRRPLGPALRLTLSAAARARNGGAARDAFWDALGGLPWVLRRRRVVPALLEARLRLLDSAPPAVRRPAHGARLSRRASG